MGIEGRWVKIHEKAQDSRVFSDPNMWHLFCLCLFRANWKTGYFKGVEIRPGQFAFSYRSLVESWGLSKNRIARAFKKLEQWGCISIKTGRDFSILTVCNYSTYQDSNFRSGTPAETPTETQAGHQRTRIVEEPEEQEQEGASASDSEVKKPAKAKRPLKFTDGDLATADWMLELILDFNPENRRPDLKSWANQIRMMREIDKRDDSRIREVFQWSMAEPFWRDKMSGPKYLRDKFGTLTGQMKTRPVEPPKPDTSTAGILRAAEKAGYRCVE